MSEHVLVQVGRETYAVPVTAVRRIAELDAITPVAGAPAAVIGVSGVLGELVPILDTGRMLGATHAGGSERIVILEEQDRVAGLAVAVVTGVAEIPVADEDVSSPHLAGATLLDGALVGIVDVRALLDSIDPRCHA
jgi:purine-binding chemotaxis protein CheW